MAEQKPTETTTERQILKAIGSGKVLSGNAQSQERYEALRQEGDELGLDLYLIFDKDTCTLVRCSPGVLAQNQGYSLREIERRTKDGSIPSQKVGRAREPVLSGDVLAQVEDYVRWVVAKYRPG